MAEKIADFDAILKKAKAARKGESLITLEGGKLHENASKAEAILIAAGAPFYVRDGSIVRPIIEEVAAFKGRRTKVVRLRRVTADMLRDHMSRAAKFERYSSRSRKFVTVDPPHDIADIILARDGDWQFPALAGVVTTPTMRPDGSILSEPGYDAATKLLLVAPPRYCRSRAVTMHSPPSPGWTGCSTSFHSSTPPAAQSRCRR